MSPVKAEALVGRIVGWGAWYYLHASQVGEGEDRNSKRTVWIKVDAIDRYRATGICIHTGQRRIALFEDIHTVMPLSYSA